VNATGLQTLFVKEVRRFFRVPGQTVLSPLISTTLYFAVFGVSLGGRLEEVTGQPYLPFIVPGLVFLGLANNAFLNTSSSLFIMKIQGTIVDLLVAPLGPGELLLGFVGGGMVRGLVVGLLTWAVALVFAGFQLAHPLVTFGFLLLPPLMAHLFARNMRQFSLLASLIGGVSALLGFALAYHWDYPVGPVDVALLGVLYALALLVKSASAHCPPWERWRPRRRPQ
jgi:hypothetical protein